MSSPLLVVISGPSGVGKDAVLHALRKTADAHYAITATTRPSRPGERDGVHHYFVDDARFRQMQADGELLESAQVYDHWYGVPKAPVREALASGHDAVVRVDVQGARAVRTLAPNALLLFIAPPSLAELERRLRLRRTESDDALARRLVAARDELQQSAWFDYVIKNETGDIERTVQRITAIMEVERGSAARGEVVL